MTWFINFLDGKGNGKWIYDLGVEFGIGVRQSNFWNLEFDNWDF
jgi:hypothetical protein